MKSEGEVKCFAIFDYIRVYKSLEFFKNLISKFYTKILSYIGI